MIKGYRFNDIHGNRICLNINTESFVGEGSYGKVYRLNKDCIKIFTESPWGYFREGIKVLEYFKENHLDGFCPIYEVLYDKNILSAYIMKYIEKLDTDLIEMDPNYLVESFIKIYESIKVLSKKLIILSDSGMNNIIIGKNGIELIDFDYYYFGTSKNYVLNTNRNELLILMDEIILTELNSKQIRLNVKPIFEFKSISDREINKKLERISKVKRIKELF